MDMISRLQESLRLKHTILLCCLCSINYDGRAQSHLPSGERVILIKQDGTILIHQPESHTPVNYMKEGVHGVEGLGDDSFVLRSNNPSRKEFLEIVVDKVLHFHSLSLEDAQKISVKGTEKDMAEMIMSNPSLISPTFKPFSREEHTKYGFVDVFGHDKGTTIIIECKRYTADLKAVSQLRRYVEKLKKSKGLDDIKGIIAAPSMSANAKEMLEDFGFEHRQIEPPKYLERYQKDQTALGRFL